MFPVIFGIATKVAGTAISAWQAAALGVGIGAVGTNLFQNNQNQQRLEDDIEEDDLEILEELLRRRRSRRKRNRKKK